MIFSIRLGTTSVTKIITPGDCTGKHEHIGHDLSDHDYSHPNSPTVQCNIVKDGGTGESLFLTFKYKTEI